MVTWDRYFARVPDYLDVGRLRAQRVVIVGTGMVGSPIAEELARCTVGHLRFIDHDILEEENLSRHVLPPEYLGWNKAEGMAVYLRGQIAGLTTEAVPRKIDASVSDEQLDRWLADADLVIAATDDRTAQRRVMQSALALDIPALAPALYVPHGGEIIFQSHWGLPCFGCWDNFRTNEEQLRGARMLGFVAWPVIHATIDLSLGILDPRSGHGQILTEAPGRPPNQIFTLDRLGMLEHAAGVRRQTCPSCGGGPVATRRPPVDAPSLADQEVDSRPLAAGSARGLPSWAIIGIGAVGLYVIVALIVSAGSSHRGTTRQATTDRTATSAASPEPATSLPLRASTSFDVSPTYTPPEAPSVGRDKASWNEAGPVGYSITPSVSGFTMRLKVKMTFTSQGASEVEGGLPGAVLGNCVAVGTTGPEDTTYHEYPSSAALHEHGGIVTGVVSYAAVLPGHYAFDPRCEGESSGDLGTVTAASQGVLLGGGLLTNGLVVYEIRRGQDDTVILFGVTDLRDTEAKPLGGACVAEKASVEAAGQVWHSRLSLRSYPRGPNGLGAYATGTMSFPVGASKLPNGVFSYGCGPGSSTIGL